MDYSNRNEDVTKKFEEMLKTNKSYFFDVQEFLDIIDEYISLANYSLAQKAIELALEQYQQNTDILLYKAELFSLQDQLEKAEEIISYLKKIEPTRAEIPLLEAEIYSRQDRHGKAVKSLEIALNISPDKADVYELLTVEYLYLSNYHKALDAAQKCLSHDPANQTALYNVVTCFDMLNQTDKAINFLEKHVDKYAFDEIAWNLLAKQYIEKKDYTKALKAIDFAIAIDDKFLSAYFDKAYAYEMLKKYDKAIEFYQLTLSISEPSAFVFYNIGENYKKLKAYEKAESCFLKAIKEDPAHYKSWLKIVQIKLDQNHIEEALNYNIKALDIINNQDLYESLAKIYILKKQSSDAISALEMSLKLGPAKLPTFLQLSDLYKQENQTEKRRKILLEAKKQFPDSGEIKKRMLNKE